MDLDAPVYLPIARHFGDQWRTTMGRPFIPMQNNASSVQPQPQTEPGSSEMNARIMANLNILHNQMRDLYDRNVSNQVEMMQRFAAARQHTPVPANPNRQELLVAIDQERRRCLVLGRYAADWADMISGLNRDFDHLTAHLPDLPPETNRPVPPEQPQP